MTPPALFRQIAAELREAERTRVAIDPISSRHPELDMADAYVISGINREKKVASGRHVVGHKIGLTSHAMQEMLGVSTPDVGTLTDEMVIKNGGKLHLEELIAGHIEAEFAFVVGSAIRGTDISRDELISAISHVGLAAEVIDSRIRDWKIGIVDTVADNASSARIVTGGMHPATPELLAQLPQTVITLHEGSELIGKGPGSAVMDDPINPLLWLANTLASQEIHLKPGDLILAGSVHRMQPMRPNTTYTVTAEGFVPVTLTTI